MIINGQTFGGTFDYEYTDGSLKLCAGNTTCICEFQPIRFPSVKIIYNFLHIFHRFRLCCFLSGTFVLFSAGVLDSFDGMSLFIAMTDSAILNFIFQKFHFPKFMIDDFTFDLVHSDRKEDTFHYTVSSKDFNMMVCITGIDTNNHCGPFSNIDFVHFVWENLLRFSYKKFAMALSPRGSFRLPKLMCLKYYRAESEGWKNHANCGDCVERHMVVLNPFLTCSGVPGECSCKLCRLQPPSLKYFARHALFNYILHLDSFEFTD